MPKSRRDCWMTLDGIRKCQLGEGVGMIQKMDKKNYCDLLGGKYRKNPHFWLIYGSRKRTTFFVLLYLKMDLYGHSSWPHPSSTFPIIPSLLSLHKNGHLCKMSETELGHKFPCSFHPPAFLLQFHYAVVVPAPPLCLMNFVCLWGPNNA